MWTEAHRARHDARRKSMVSADAGEQVAAWLERADPPRSGRATPTVAVVGAIMWHRRVGGSWRALPLCCPHWRTVYGWFRGWQELGLFDAPLRPVARLRRRARGRERDPRPALVDTQSVKGLPVAGSRGCDAAKKVLGRKRVAVVDGDGAWLAVAIVPANTQDRDGTACAAAWSSVPRTRRALLVRSGGGASSAASAFLSVGAGCCASRLDVAAARVTLLSGVEALVNPMPVQNQPC